MKIFGKRLKKETRIPYHPGKKPEYPGEISIENIRAAFADCDDFLIREVYINGDSSQKAYICFIDGLVDGRAVSENIVRPLTRNDSIGENETEKSAFDKVSSGGIYNAEAKVCEDLDTVLLEILKGSCAVVFQDGHAAAFESRSGEKRSVSEPTVENVIKGSKDSFVETLNVNTALVRRKINSPKLKIKRLTVGRQSHTTVALVFYEGLTNSDIVSQAEKRINAIDIDGLISMGNFEEYMYDNPKSIFPQMLYTERAGGFANQILDGMAGVLINGLPFGYLFPATFETFMRAPEEKSENYVISSVLSVLRYISVVITLLAPGFYVALASFHHEMIPTSLLLSIIESKKNVPFTTAEESIVMLLAFEVLQEAGLRLPQNIGQTVSIIGGLIVGQSAVEAQLVSPVVVIVIAASGITGYVVPNQDLAAAFRIWRFILTVISALMGMFGLAMGMALMIYKMGCVESFGVPYLEPFSVSGKKGILRAILRYRLPDDKIRDLNLEPENLRNQK